MTLSSKLLALESKEGEEKFQIKRKITLLGGISVIVGSMIGSGIFVSPVGILRNTGSVGVSLIIWVLCGIVATCGSLTYAELGTMIPKSGAEYPYLKEAFGPFPAFMFAWTSSIVLKPSSVAIIGIVFGEYLMKPFFPMCDKAPLIVVKLVSAACIVFVTFLNCFSVKIAEKTQIIFTTAKLMILLVVCGAGFYGLATGTKNNLKTAFDEKVSWSTIGTAFYQGFWAYDGWNQLNYITEELKNPYVNLKRAICIGIPFVTFIYLLINIAYLGGLSALEMMTSSAVAVSFGTKFLGSAAWIISVGVAMSTFGSINGFSITGPRITYTAARMGDLPQIFGMLHCKRYTPTPAILFQNIIALIVLIPNDFNTLINYFSFTMWIFHGGSALALIVLRWRQPNRPRPYKVPIFIPIFVLLVSIYLVIYPIIWKPALEYLYATLFVLSGLLFYIPFVRYGRNHACGSDVTKFLQILLEVAPVCEK